MMQPRTSSQVGFGGLVTTETVRGCIMTTCQVDIEWIVSEIICADDDDVGYDIIIS